MSTGPLRNTKPAGMDPATWAAFRSAWNAATTWKIREQLCAEYGISGTTAYKYAKRGVGLVRGFHNRSGG